MPPVSNVLYRITIDHLDGMTYVPECAVDDVSLESMTRTVKLLDGDTRTMVVLEARGDASPRLTIGGRQGAYIVLYTRHGADAGWWQAMSDGDDRTTLTLVVGGQDGDYPLDVVSDERSMWRAAEYFVATGDMDPALRWKKD